MTLLPGAEITLDRFTLMDASDGDLEVHPAGGAATDPAAWLAAAGVAP